MVVSNMDAVDKFDKLKFQQLLDAKEIKLNPPLEPAALAHLSGVAKPSIPSQLVDLLEFGDGQSRHTSPALFGGIFLESSKNMAGWITWHHEEEQGGPSDCFSDCPFVQQGKLWQQEWIPIAYDAGLVFLYIDCAPSSQGTYGQIILSSINTGKCGVIANDLNELVAFSIERDEILSAWPLLVHKSR